MRGFPTFINWSISAMILNYAKSHPDHPNAPSIEAAMMKRNRYRQYCRIPIGWVGRYGRALLRAWSISCSGSNIRGAQGVLSRSDRTYGKNPGTAHAAKAISCEIELTTDWPGKTGPFVYEKQVSHSNNRLWMLISSVADGLGAVSVRRGGWGARIYID